MYFQYIREVLELVVKSQLEEHLDVNSIMISEQSSFRKGHSCETALQFVISE